MTTMNSATVPGGHPGKGITRKRLLEIAEELLQHRAPSQITMAEVAREAGLDPSSMYKHFGNKDHLFAEMIRDRMGDLFDKTVPEPGETFGEYIVRTIDDVFALWAQRAPLLRTAMALAGSNEEFGDLWHRQVMGPWKDNYGRLYTRDVAAGRLPRLDLLPGYSWEVGVDQAMTLAMNMGMNSIYEVFRTPTPEREIEIRKQAIIEAVFHRFEIPRAPENDGQGPGAAAGDPIEKSGNTDGHTPPDSSAAH